jgi:hypothetical protein
MPIDLASAACEIFSDFRRLLMRNPIGARMSPLLRRRAACQHIDSNTPFSKQ